MQMTIRRHAQRKRRSGSRSASFEVTHFLLRSGGPKDLKIPAQIQDLTFQCCGPTILEHSNLGKIEQNRVYTTSTKKKCIYIYIFLCIVCVNRHESMAFLYVYMRHVSRETHGFRISLILKNICPRLSQCISDTSIIVFCECLASGICVQQSSSWIPTCRELPGLMALTILWKPTQDIFLFIVLYLHGKKHDSSDWFKMCAKKHLQTCRRKYDIYI